MKRTQMSTLNNLLNETMVQLTCKEETWIHNYWNPSLTIVLWLLKGKNQRKEETQKMPDVFVETIKYNPIKSTAYRGIKIIINHFFEI